MKVFYKFQLRKRIGLGTLNKKIRKAGGDSGIWSGPIFERSVRIPVGEEALLLELIKAVGIRCFISLSVLRQDKWEEEGWIESSSMMTYGELVAFVENATPGLIAKIEELDKEGYKMRNMLGELLSEEAKTVIPWMTDTKVKDTINGLCWVIGALNFSQTLDNHSKM